MCIGSSELTFNVFKKLILHFEGVGKTKQMMRPTISNDRPIPIWQQKLIFTIKKLKKNMPSIVSKKYTHNIKALSALERLFGYDIECSRKRRISSVIFTTGTNI